MINTQYKLTAPMSVETFCVNVDRNEDTVLVKPEKMSICKADMRYYFGLRDAKVLKQRLPLTLIHEAWGTVLYDKSGAFKRGDKVIMLPNIPGKDERIGENYRLDSKFRSSKADGFMQEIVSIPGSQLVPFTNIQPEIAAFTEFISVGVHALNAYMARRKREPERIAVWGDGALGYVVCSLIKYYMPKVNLTVIGINRARLDLFHFADARLTIDELTPEHCFDDTFECVGGQASGDAINQMIDLIMPEGTIMLLGVSENPVPINTRMVLEKGLTLIGRSRSAKEDFEKAVEILETNTKFAGRMSTLVSNVIEIKGINDIHKAFNESQIVDFKLIMDWKL